MLSIRIAAVTSILFAAPVQANEPAIPNVFFYRVYAEPTLAAATIRINTVKVFTLPNRDYAQTNYPPGRYIVTVTWPWWTGQQTSETAITIGDDTEHYLKISSPNPKVGYEPDEARVRISEVPISVGLVELNDLRAVHFVR